jgi:TIR domain
MKLFISHAQVDIEVAHALQLRLDELSGELSCFLLADEVFAGDNWEERIREAAKTCDAILCLATADYIERPWFAAEWALFWFQDKPWYLTLHDVSLESVFAPLGRRQAVRLDDRRSVERLMRSLIEHGKLTSVAATDLLANETVTAIREAEKRSAVARAEVDLAQFAVSLRRGTDNVDAELVERLVSIDRLDSMMQLASQEDNSVALRQLAVLLLPLGEFNAASRLGARIENLAERSKIGVAALDELARDSENVRALDLLLETYGSVREPQRRGLRAAAESRGIDIDWPDVTAES